MYGKENEETVRKYWEEHSIPEKARSLNKGSENRFYFADGPPYATGKIHLGTALNKILKDVTIRFWRMKGYWVFDRPGYDTHGLPIENKVEKKLGFKSKKDIEEFGIENFINECKKFATEYIGEMNKQFYNLGVWMDWDNPYLTLTNEYIEALWWTFKKAEEKGLLYKGKYPVHVCPHCGTVVAYNEIEYKTLEDPSVFLKFKLLDEESTYLVVWTTTPWTLPSNTGVMINPKETYVKVRVGEEFWIFAEKRLKYLEKEFDMSFEVYDSFFGKELVGKRYENPLAKYISRDISSEGGYRVVPSERFVSMEEGTGLVHCAPGHGKEDYQVGMENNLPLMSPLTIEGIFTEEAGKYKGMFARDANNIILKDLEKENALIKIGKIKHEYPVCWRCKTPLLMVATEQWFFKVSKIKDKLISFNEEVYWVPEWGKARMRNWLESLGDWPVSRQRYWGTPLPIWVCKKCGKRVVVGSIEELKRYKPNKDVDNVELHKPYIDEITLKCPSCGGEMKRVPEVLDVWFDSGAASWGALGFPKRKDLFELFWPADINIEGTDQFRGWWNSQLITSAICFDKKPFKRIMLHGLVLDLNRVKMSKSIGNVVTPEEVIEKYSRDHLRYFMVRESRGDDLRFDWNAFKEITRFFSLLENIFVFSNTYSSFSKETPEKLKLEDKWILSRVDSLQTEALKAYENLYYYKVPLLVQDFVLKDLSRDYIQIIRRRAKNEDEKKVLGFVFYYVLKKLLTVLSPIVPHLSEYLYLTYLRNVENKESVHFLNFEDPEFLDKELEKKMDEVKSIVDTLLYLRDKNKIKKRYVLERAYISSNAYEGFKEIIKAGANVKEVIFTSEFPESVDVEERNNVKVGLDILVSDSLRREWIISEIRRRIQQYRKKKGLNVGEKAKITLFLDNIKLTEEELKKLEEETNSEIELSEKPGEEKHQFLGVSLSFLD